MRTRAREPNPVDTPYTASPESSSVATIEAARAIASRALLLRITGAPDLATAITSAGSIPSVPSSTAWISSTALKSGADDTARRAGIRYGVDQARKNHAIPLRLEQPRAGCRPDLDRILGRLGARGE